MAIPIYSFVSAVFKNNTNHKHYYQQLWAKDGIHFYYIDNVAPPCVRNVELISLEMIGEKMSNWIRKDFKSNIKEITIHYINGKQKNLINPNFNG